LVGRYPLGQQDRKGVLESTCSVKHDDFRWAPIVLARVFRAVSVAGIKALSPFGSLYRYPVSEIGELQVARRSSSARVSDRQLCLFRRLDEVGMRSLVGLGFHSSFNSPMAFEIGSSIRA